jgi:hypothetical protein
MRKSLTKLSASCALVFLLLFCLTAPLHLHLRTDGIDKECALCLAIGGASKAITRAVAIFAALWFLAFFTITDRDFRPPLFSVGSLIRGPPALP